MGTYKRGMACPESKVKTQHATQRRKESTEERKLLPRHEILRLNRCSYVIILESQSPPGFRYVDHVAGHG